MGFETTVNTSSVASSCGCTNATIGAVASCGGAFGASTVIRTVPVASLTPSVTVKSTRNVPGDVVAKSKVVVPSTIVALASALSSTRADSSDIFPLVPVTCGATSTVIPASRVSTTANDCTVSFGCGDTRTTRGLRTI